MFPTSRVLFNRLPVATLPKCSQFFKQRAITTTISRFFSTNGSRLSQQHHQFHQYAHNTKQSNSSTFNTPLLGVALGLVGSTAIYTSQAPLDNEYVNEVTLQAEKQLRDAKSTSKFDGSFKGKLNYHELSIGSMCGAVAGIIAGKLSSIFMFLGISFYLGLQFLNSRGIITVPFTKVIKVGSQVIDVREMIFEQPSFNIAFLLAFFIAAYNI